MEIFSSVIFQIAVLFSFIFIGFTIRQGGFLPENSAEIFSKLENRILMPAVVINTFRTNCTVKNISEKWVFIAYSTGVLLFCIATGFAVSRFLGKTEYLKRCTAIQFPFQISDLSELQWCREYTAQKAWSFSTILCSLYRLICLLIQ